ncbi:hypothetical protein [uncultured Croceitalea sp.]|uniref:hypothetical protein n=1 Tax=uncultured Croceitalea sp. TaxID=1798908 RepID=UPI00330666E7
MKLKVLLLAALATCVIGCSNDDNFTEEPQQLQKASFKVVGEDASSVYLFSFDGNLETSTTDNLTQEIGVQPNYLTLRQLDNLLSFYSFSEGVFSLVQIDIETNTIASFDDFYANGPGRSVVWGTNNLNTVFFGYFTPGNARNLAIQNVELPSLDSQDFTIDFNIDTLFQPIQFNGKIFLTYRDSLGNYKVTFYDTISKTQGPIVNFNTVPVSILIDNAGDLAVVKNGVDATLEKYDSNSLVFLSSEELNFNSGFVPGPIDGAVLSEDRLYYSKPFVQPARFSAGPAIFDLVTQENIVVDLASIADKLEEELEASIILVGQRFSKSQKVFLVSYAVVSQEIKGGVAQISTDGNLISNTTFPFQPNVILED